MPSFDPFYLLRQAGTETVEYINGTVPSAPAPVPVTAAQIDPATPKAGDNAVRVQQPSQIKEISEALFGGVGSAAKSFFEVKAVQQARAGQPLYINQRSMESAGLGTGLVVAGGVVGFLLVGVLLWSILR